MSRNPSYQVPVFSAAGRTDRSAPYQPPTLESSPSAVDSVQDLPLAAGPNGKKPKSAKLRFQKPNPPSSSAVLFGIPVMSESELEKKRNKLGYQRISIACAHCRRRKIRCLIAEGDPQARCQNCIRLKKECVFYPVDQQGAIDDRSQPSAQASTGSGSTSTVSSSPNNSASDLPQEGASEFNGFHIPPSASGSFQSLSMDTGDLVEPESVYSSPLETRQAWGPPPNFDSGTRSAGVPLGGQSYWRGSEPSGTGGEYATYPVNTAQQYSNPMYVPGIDYGQRGGQGWQGPPPPGRTMSYGMVESFPPHPLHGFGGPVTSDVQRRPSQAAYPPPPAPLDIRSASVASHHGGPQSAPIGLPPTQFGQPESYMYNHGQVQQSNYPTPWYTGHSPYEDAVNVSAGHGGQTQYHSMPRHPS